MIHYFNPGNETAILNGSKYYQPPTSVVKLQHKWAFLPAGYADPEDFVLIHESLPETFLQKIASLNIAKPLLISDLEKNRAKIEGQKIELWALSLADIHYLQQLSDKHHLNWQLPEWHDEFRTLSSRFTAHQILSILCKTVIANEMKQSTEPTKMDRLLCYPRNDKSLLPHVFSTLEEVENYVMQCTEKQLIKAPYSSSGRGLVWLPPKKLAQSERQIISGILKKQQQVSVERALDKVLDFSMHFILDEKTANFIGYSIFLTNEKGAYQKSIVNTQEKLEQQITAFVSVESLEKVKTILKENLPKIYSAHYQGNIGVDMLIYRDENQYRLHPCVEINLRKSMGYLAIRSQSKGYSLPLPYEK